VTNSMLSVGEFFVTSTSRLLTGISLIEMSNHNVFYFMVFLSHLDHLQGNLDIESDSAAGMLMFSCGWGQSGPWFPFK
jgi:hypothetical protein